MTWLAAVAYAIGVFVTARQIAVQMTHKTTDEKYLPAPDNVDRMLYAGLGMAAGMFWPLLLLVAIVAWRVPPSPGQLQKALAESERERVASSRRIDELERRLGIKK